MTTTPVRFGLIGFGAWGAHHAAAIAADAGAELVAIADVREEARESALKLYPDVNVFDDFHELVQRPDLDVVDLVTPNHLHRDMAVAAIDAGKHLLIEKPMCLTAAECDEVRCLAERRKRRIAVVHQFRLSSLWGKIKALVDDGLVGVPQYVLVELSRNPYRPGADGWRFDADRVGDWILEEPIHFFDLARWCLSSVGEPKSVYAVANSRQAGRPELQDNCSAVVQFPDGAYAVVSQTLAAFEHHQTMKVAGTKGALWAGWSGALDRTRHPTFFLKTFDGSQVEEIEITKMAGELFELEEQIRAMVEVVRNGVAPPSDAEDGKWSVALCLAAQLSVREKREVPMREVLEE